MRAVPALLLLLAPAAAAAQPAPKLRAGLWEQTTEIEGLPAALRKPSYMCVDDASQQRMSVFGQQAGACTQTQMQRTPDGMRFASSCTMRGMKTTTTGVVKGDFNSRYEMTATTTGVGPRPSVVHGVNRYLGPCKDLKPGQMRVMGMVVDVGARR